VEDWSGRPLGLRETESSPSSGAGSRAGDERKLATVVFADLVGSTELGGSQDPERVRALLDRFYDAMAAEIESAGGTVEKFAGDAVMAAFGAPRAHEDHAERALHAALSMQRRLVELFDRALVLRIGVNTGEVVVGRAREGSSFVTGDAVNVAARLEQAAAPGEILVGERTVGAVRGAFEFAEPAIVEARGKPEGVACRRLLRALSLMRPRGVSGLRRAFVGREAELAGLRAAYGRVVERGTPHLVTISGEAGVGKTRLVREFWEELATQSPEPLRRTGRCLSYGQGITYWPLGEILKEHFGILETDRPDAVRLRLGKREILGLTLGLDVAGELHPLAVRDRLHAGWVDFMDTATAERPVVVLVEDIHWAEPTLLDLLDGLLRDVRGPLLMIATARPELFDLRPGWGGARRDASTIELEALSSEAALGMLGQLLAGELPDHVSEMVVRQAEGNPFFVEELVGSLIDQGLLTRSNGAWSISALPAGFTVPDSVQAVLAARIDLLPAAEKAALKAASVIGRVFWTGPVYELVPELEPDFRTLEDRDFVRRRAGSTIAGETEYAFKHQLTREVAYAGLTKGNRARLHAGFAAWLERFGGGRDEHASLLAHHYVEAVRPADTDIAWEGKEEEFERLRAKALAWLSRAAELAVAGYALDEALELLHRALELEPGERGRSDLWSRIGRANALKFDGEAFWKAMLNAIELADEGDLADLYSDLAVETAGRPGMWTRRPDPALVRSWIDRALELAPPASAARAKALIALAAWDPVNGVEPAREAVEIAERIENPELEDEAVATVAKAAFVNDRFEEALDRARSRVDLRDQIANPDIRAGIHFTAVYTSLGCAHMDEARDHARLLWETSRRLSAHHVVHGVALRAMVEELEGRWDQVRAMASEVEHAVADNIATPCTMNSRSLLVCALASAHAGDDGEAQRLEACTDALGMEGYGLTIEAPRIRLLLLRGDLEGVDRLLDSGGAMYFARTAAAAARLDALAALGRRDRVEEEAEPLLQPNTYLEPFALRALGLAREDEKLILQALDRFETMGLDWHADETRALLRD
jgi:class 3 adenylate cyclase